MTKQEQFDRAMSIHRALSDGQPRSQVASENGVNSRAIGQIMRGESYPDAYEAFHGTPPKSKQNNPPPLPDEMIHRIHKMSKVGHDMAAISAATGVKKDAVKRYLIGNGRREIWEQYNHTFSSDLLTRPWGPATKPGGEVVVLNEAA